MPMVPVLAWTAVFGAAYVTPMRPASALYSRVSEQPMMVKLSKSSSSWSSVEQDLLSSLGLDDNGDEQEHALDDAVDSSTDGGVPSPTDSKPSTPRSGAGDSLLKRWSHEDESVELDLELPDGVRAKDLVCEVSKLGAMRVESPGRTLLSGQLALPVDRTELTWLVEGQDDGSKLLCIELPMLPIDTGSRSRAVDCIFDESLMLDGQPCLEPGLSGVGGRA